MSAREVQWLLAELKHWVNEGLVTPQTAEALRGRYAGGDTGDSGRSIVLTVFAILGALLIGGGIILLLAHNWDGIPRPVRALLALLPLAAGFGVGGRTLLRQAGAAWREGAATFLFLALGAAIALVGQTYHMGGTVRAFLLTWMLAGLPLVYLFESHAVLILYLAGIMAWGLMGLDEGAKAQVTARGIGWLGLAAAPAVAALWSERGRPGSVPVFLAVAICLPIFLLLGLAHDYLASHWLALFPMLAGVYVLADRMDPAEPAGYSRHPLSTLGRLALLGLAFAMTFREFWRDVMSHLRLDEAFLFKTHPIEGSVWAALLAGGGLLLAWNLYRRNGPACLYGVFPFLLLFLGSEERAGLGTVVANVFVFAVGLHAILAGWRRLDIGQVNIGMLILAAWIAMRFFDVDMTFLVRGLLFILLGAAFLAGNVFLARRRKAAHAAGRKAARPS